MTAFPRRGTPDTKTGLVSDGKKWITWAQYKAEEQRFATKHREWMESQGMQPKKVTEDDL